MSKEEKEIERFKKLMGEHGFKIDIWGCGCCGSPSIDVSYKGEEILCTEGEEIKMSEE